MPFGALAIALAMSGACTPRCDGDLEGARFVERDRVGNIEWSIESDYSTNAVGKYDVCDSAGRRIGHVADYALKGAQTVESTDNSGATVAKSVHYLSGGGFKADRTIVRPSGTLRIHRAPDLLRILDEQGVPLGQIGEQPGAQRTFAYDAGGRPFASAELVNGRIALHGIDGAVEHLVTGLRSERAAAALALAALSPLERVTLALALDGE